MLLLFLLYESQFIYKLCEFDFEPSTADKKASSLDRFLSYMNEEDILDNLPGAGNVITSDLRGMALNRCPI